MWILFTTRLFRNCLYDYWRFFNYSGANPKRQYHGERAARLTMAFHQLEKGLSLSAPRPGFGKEVAARLIQDIGTFVADFGFIEPAPSALGALNAYIAFNEEHNIDVATLKAAVSQCLLGVAGSTPECPAGGTWTVDRDDLEKKRNAGFMPFFNSRHSVRHFSGGPIPEAHIREAIRLAQKTPSVCNRQAWKAHVYSKSEDVASLLAIQAGSRGFGEQVSAVLVVTCDLTRFVNVGERYQAWIDGGMFSMATCLALHSLGYGTCCLTWAKEMHTDMALRKAAHIGTEEQIIMLIAVGTLPQTFRVARSPRRPLQDALQFH